MIDLEKSIFGNLLSKPDRAYVLSAYVYRHTPDHASVAKPSSRPLAFTHASDAEWLANTRFQVTKAGRLDRRVKGCWSTPTWPFNPEFRNSARNVPLKGAA